MSVKNHQIPPTILVERALGMSSDPEREEQRRVVRPGTASGWGGGSTLPGSHTHIHRKWAEWAAAWVDVSFLRASD